MFFELPRIHTDQYMTGAHMVHNHTPKHFMVHLVRKETLAETKKLQSGSSYGPKK